MQSMLKPPTSGRRTRGSDVTARMGLPVGTPHDAAISWIAAIGEGVAEIP